jgi:hypothetical protein
MKKPNLKKALLKKLIKGKDAGKSPLTKMDNGLGATPVVSNPDAITGGGGSNLGKNGIF